MQRKLIKDIKIFFSLPSNKFKNYVIIVDTLQQRLNLISNSILIRNKTTILSIDEFLGINTHIIKTFGKVALFTQNHDIIYICEQFFKPYQILYNE